MGNVMDDFVKYQSAQAIRDAAQNKGGTSVGVELGAGMAIGEMMRETLKNDKPEKKRPTTFCPECGAENRKTAKFCSECGKKMATQKGVCPSCKATLPPKAKFCPECGQKI